MSSQADWSCQIGSKSWVKFCGLELFLGCVAIKLIFSFISRIHGIHSFLDFYKNWSFIKQSGYNCIFQIMKLYNYLSSI